VCWCHAPVVASASSWQGDLTLAGQVPLTVVAMRPAVVDPRIRDVRLVWLWGSGALAVKRLSGAGRTLLESLWFCMVTNPDAVTRIFLTP